MFQIKGRQVYLFVVKPPYPRLNYSFYAKWQLLLLKIETMFKECQAIVNINVKEYY